MSGEWNAERVAAFREGFFQFVEQVEINSKELGKARLGDHIYRAQHMFLDGVFDALSDDIHDIYVLKSRQLGISTIARALSLFWLGIHDGLKGVMVFDTSYNTSNARREIVGMIKNLPKSVRFPRIQDNNRDGIVLENESQLLFMAAGVKETRTGGGLGRSIDTNFVHASEMCVAKDTLITVGNGRIKPISAVVAGDVVVTHSGDSAEVKAVIQRANSKKMIRITPFLGPYIECTFDHKIMTARGLVEARHLTRSDKLVLPIRTITDRKQKFFLRDHRPHPVYGGAVSVGASQQVVINEELGFAVGYYLAEGCIVYTPGDGNKYKYKSAIQFTHHENEDFYARRAQKALELYSTKALPSRYLSAKSKAKVTRVSGAAITEWFEEMFGARGDKRIPDEVFSLGHAFCRGLVAGYLSGDGSKGGLVRNGARHKNNTVSIHSANAGMAFQLRDLVVALGYGLGGVRRRAAGKRVVNRIDGQTTINQSEHWMIDWSGKCAAELRRLMGIEPYPVFKRRPANWTIVGGRLLVDIRMTECLDRIDDVVYDISLDHPDHTYRTVGITVSNCSWANEEGLISFRQSLAQDYPDRLYLWESTARGFNQWHDMWVDACEDENKKAIFFGWWAKDNQIISHESRDFLKYGTDPPTPTELKRIHAVKDEYDWDITQEQLAWYRKRSDPTQEREDGEPEDTYLLAEQPWTSEEAFQQTGSTFFDAEKLTAASLRIATSPRPQHFRFLPGVEHFIDSDFSVARHRRDMELQIWEEPVQDSTYIVAGDPAFGHNEYNNNSAAQVMRCYADGIDQVAEYASAVIQPHHFAWLLWSLIGYYGARPNNRVLMICELNGPGEEVFRQYRQVQVLLNQGYMRQAAEKKGVANITNNVRNYVFGRSDSLTSGQSLMWKTQTQNKIQLFEAVRNYTHSNTILWRSIAAIEEMRTITRDGDTIGAPGNRRDDRTFAGALAVRAWDEKLRRGLVTGNRTREAERARLSASVIDQYALFNRSALDYFLKEKQTMREQAATRAHRAAWRGSNGSMRRLIPATRRF